VKRVKPLGYYSHLIPENKYSRRKTDWVKIYQYKNINILFRRHEMFGTKNILIITMILALFVGNAIAAEPAAKAEKKTAAEIAIIETSYGKMKIRFFPDKAPNHVENFKKLARSGFYDGTIFHRVIPDFMIQGGDPLSKGDDRNRMGSGGPGYTIDAEFNDTHHKRGILSMARASDPNSAGSQFFICVKEAGFLDRQYTAFGEVYEGMDVADMIVNQPRDPRDNPISKIEMKVKIVPAK
jgi:cyclophilin family peptidyl-prolyl cis-trans isomerase